VLEPQRFMGCGTAPERNMAPAPTVQDLLHDPMLSFSDFCIISNALKDGVSEEEIHERPELDHLRITADTFPHSSSSPSCFLSADPVHFSTKTGQITSAPGKRRGGWCRLNC
jgi:hypothetical protein